MAITSIHDEGSETCRVRSITEGGSLDGGEALLPCTGANSYIGRACFERQPKLS